MLNQRRTVEGRGITKKREKPIQSAGLEAKWLASEDDFVLKQIKRGALVRTRENRHTPADQLVAIAWLFDEHSEEYDDDDNMRALSSKLISPVELISGMTSVSDLDSLETRINYITNLETLTKVKRFWSVCLQLIGAQKSHLLEDKLSVSEDVEAIISGKSVKQLEELELNVKENVQSSSLDTNFWVQLLKDLQAKKASLILTEIYKEALFLLPAVSIPLEPATSSSKESHSAQQIPAVAPPLLEETPPVPEVDLPNARDGLTPVYSIETRMGFEWNRYNQKHYDQDNPPPKAVQGYSFELHYPKLKNSPKIPTYRIVSDKDSDTCVIKFQAPNIYRDLAFRIVNKPWDKSARFAEYVSKFEDGILRLNFRFKRHKYKT